MPEMTEYPYPLLPCTVCGAMADREGGRVAMVEIEKLRKLLWMLQDQSYHPSGYLKDAIEAAVKYE